MRSADIYQDKHQNEAIFVTSVAHFSILFLQKKCLTESSGFGSAQDVSPYDITFTFTGKERDEETGFSYFGARYYDSDLSGLFLSVDPMADKYPSISPYAYCAWNPLKLIDSDGNDAVIPPSWVRTFWFTLKHPNIASAIGPCIEGQMNTNISTRSSRFATRGSSQSDQQTIFRSNGCEDDVDPCSERGAFRHTLWQATITSYYGSDIATEVGNAHENNPNADLTARNFSSMLDADQVVDLLNNMLGRTIGENNPNCPMNELAGKVLETFYTSGLYTGKLNDDGTWSVSRTTITKEQYDSYKKVLSGLDYNGFNSAERVNYQAKCEQVNRAIQDACRWIDNK